MGASPRFLRRVKQLPVDLWQESRTSWRPLPYPAGAKERDRHRIALTKILPCRPVSWCSARNALCHDRTRKPAQFRLSWRR